MEDWDSTEIPERWDAIGSAREPFQKALQQYFASEQAPRLLIYTPIYETPHRQEPACLLAITVQGWVLFIADPDSDNDLDLVQASFEQTLWIELTSILHYGRLSLAFASDNEVLQVDIEFNAVMWNFYYEAAQLVLLGIEGRKERPAPDRREGNRSKVAALPARFGQALLDSIPPDECLQAVASWPVLWSKPLLHLFSHELSPAGALGVLTRTLLVVQDEYGEGEAGLEEDRLAGTRVFLMSKARLVGWSAKPMRDLTTITLMLRAPTIELPWEMVVPTALSQDVLSTLQACGPLVHEKNEDRSCHRTS